MENINAFLEVVEGKLDWIPSDWILFYDAVYLDVIQDINLVKINGRLKYEIRDPTEREVIAILRAIQRAYANNVEIRVYVEKLIRSQQPARTRAFEELTVIISNNPFPPPPDIPEDAVMYYDDGVLTTEGIRYYDDGIESVDYVEYVDL